MNEPNPEWVPAEYEVAIQHKVKTKGGVTISIQGTINSHKATEGMRVHKAIHDFLQSL